MDGIREFLEMGGHGGFIWSAYGMVAFVLLGLWLLSRRFARVSQTELDGLHVDRPHRRARKSDETQT